MNKKKTSTKIQSETIKKKSNSRETLKSPICSFLDD